MEISIQSHCSLLKIEGAMQKLGGESLKMTQIWTLLWLNLLENRWNSKKGDLPPASLSSTTLQSEKYKISSALDKFNLLYCLEILF